MVNKIKMLLLANYVHCLVVGADWLPSESKTNILFWSNRRGSASLKVNSVFFSSLRLFFSQNGLTYGYEMGMRIWG